MEKKEKMFLAYPPPPACVISFVCLALELWSNLPLSSSIAIY